MDIFKINKIECILKHNPYVGRGIIIGESEDSRYACFAYFIMGRSENSRNRIFQKTDDGIIIYPFDSSKVEDPSLIIYSPVRRFENQVIVTNGDQTDTVIEYLKNGNSFYDALKTRDFEPDKPNYTPRISGVLKLDSKFDYSLSILKSNDEYGSNCNRFTFDYKPICGLGHFIHTYVTDGNPIPTFQGEPERVLVPNSIDDFTNQIWNNLNENNKISLYVEYIDLKTKEVKYRLMNKNK